MPLSRRQLLERTCLGSGSMVLAGLLHANPIASGLRAKPRHFPAKAIEIRTVRHGHFRDAAVYGGDVDDLCFIRSMHTEHNNHLEGLNMLLRCKIFPGRPALGAWNGYAPGTENQRLPAWANGYPPALYLGVEFSTKGDAGASSGAKAAPEEAKQKAFRSFAQALLSSNEFLYID